MRTIEKKLEETPIEEVTYCRDCEQRIHEECGIDGHEVYDDSICSLDGYK